MNEYNEKFPLGLSEEEKSALTWKIEQDYLQFEMGAIAFKDGFMTFAINFYTRNARSLENIVTKYQLHKQQEQRKNVADMFLTDMKVRLRARELAHN